MKSKKLSKSEFARALKLGHGRALLHIREYGDQGLKSLVLESLVQSYVFSELFEGTRNVWLSKLVATTGNTEYYATQCLSSFRDDLTLKNQSQQIKLSALFFEQGFYEFRDLMFEKFRMTYKSEKGILSCGFDLVNVAGLPGLLYVAQTISLDPERADPYYCGNILRHAKEMTSDENVEAYLKEACLLNPDLNKFTELCDAFEKVETEISAHANTKKDIQSIPELMKLFENPERRKFRISFMRFGKIASEEQLKEIVQILLNSTSTHQQTTLFQVFDSRPLPFIDERILEFLEVDDQKLRRSAGIAISHTVSTLVRTRALKLLQSKNPNSIVAAIGLLEKNYRKGDSGKILSALKRLTDPEQIHTTGMDIRDMARLAIDKSLKSCLLWHYENNPDTYCRNSFLEILYEWNEIPEDILFEAQWDAGDEVRTYARTLNLQR